MLKVEIGHAILAKQRKFDMHRSDCMVLGRPTFFNNALRHQIRL